MFEECICRCDGLFLRTIFSTDKDQDSVFVLNPNRLIPKQPCSTIGLNSTGKGKQRAAQFGKPNRRSNNKIVTGFKIGIYVLHIIIYDAAWIAPTMAAVKTRANIVKVRRHDPNITI